MPKNMDFKYFRFEISHYFETFREEFRICTAVLRSRDVPLGSDEQSEGNCIVRVGTVYQTDSAQPQGAAHLKAA